MRLSRLLTILLFTASSSSSSGPPCALLNSLVQPVARDSWLHHPKLECSAPTPHQGRRSDVDQTALNDVGIPHTTCDSSRRQGCRYGRGLALRLYGGAHEPEAGDGAERQQTETSKREMRCEDDPAIQYMIPMRTQAAHEEHVPEHDENIFMTDQEITRRNRGRNFNTQRELCPFFESGSGANESFGALEDEELQEWDQLKENQIKFGKPIPVFDAEEYGIAVNQDATKDGENDNEYETWANNTQDMDEETRYSRVLPPPASSFIEEDSLTSELSSEEVVLRESNISGEDYDTVELRGLPAALNYIVNDWQDWLEGDIEEFVPMKKEEFPPELIEWLEENQHHVNPMLRTGLIKEGFIKPLPRPPRPPKVVQEDAQTNLNETSSVDVSMPRPGSFADQESSNPPSAFPAGAIGDHQEAWHERGEARRGDYVRRGGRRGSQETTDHHSEHGGSRFTNVRRPRRAGRVVRGRGGWRHEAPDPESERKPAPLSWADIAKRSAATPLEDITRDFTDKTQDN